MNDQEKADAGKTFDLVNSIKFGEIVRPALLVQASAVLDE